MKTMILTAAVALFCAPGAYAHMAEGGGGKHHCIMAKAETWTQLGLSAEQLAKVEEIQASCKKDYEAAKAAGTDASASVATHEEQLKAVLTPEQHTAWTTWCAEKKASKAAPAEEPPAQ